MDRLLLTGIGGFVGAHTFAHIMHNTDWHVVGTDSFKHKGKADRVAQMLDTHPEWRERLTMITHDLTAPFTPQTIERIERDGGIDYVIAMASESHVDRSIEDPVPFVLNNVNVILNTLEFCRATRPEKVIIVSTDEVYGPEIENRPHSEWASVKPSNPYSASKACQEAIAISYWRTYGVRLIITNTMNIIGEMQDPEKFLPMLISDIQNCNEVIVHGTDKDVGTRYYLHARNAADAWLYILNNVRVRTYAEGAPQPERFNVVGDVRLSNLELAQLVAQHMDSDLFYKLVDFHSARPGHDAHYGLDGAKLWFHGWTAPLSFETSLKKTINWTLEHPEWLL